jgi:hypothetical protein
MDCYRVFDSQHMYECTDCESCNNCQFLQRCKTCFDAYLCLDCDNCKHCIGCKNLKNKEYYAYNTQVTPEVFEAIKQDFLKNPVTRKEIFQKAKEVKYIFPSKNFTLTQCENIESSNQCFNSKNITHCFDVVNSRDIKYTCEMLLE